LQQLTDDEIAEVALAMFGRRPDRERIAAERERLFGRVGVAA
jgi:hypothetical protein